MKQAVISPFTVRLAKTEADQIAAQRLRYDVFVEELGGDGDGVDHIARREIDRFDDHADQMLAIDDASGQVVGVYRLFLPEAAARCGGFYSASEFDLTPLERSGKRLLELGRTCLHRDYRGGTVLSALWQGLAGYVTDNKVDLLFGVASFHGTDLAALAPSLSVLHHHYLAPPELRVTSRCPSFDAGQILPPDQLDRRAAMLAVPGLIKAYLRAGGMIGQGGFVDHDFNTTDVCVILDAHTAKLTRERKDGRA